MEYAEWEWRRFSLYLTRDSENKKLDFARVSWPKVLFSHNGMLGIFLGRVNMLPGYKGWEVFTNNIGFGWCSSTDCEKVKWGGSSKEPYCHVGYRFGHLGFVLGKPPAWLVRRVKRREDAKYEAMVAEWEERLDKWEEDNGGTSQA
jgi:hypothetical protein